MTIDRGRQIGRSALPALQAHDSSPQDQGGWSVAGDTGAYAGANGGGSVVGHYNPDGVEDHYAGALRG